MEKENKTYEKFCKRCKKVFLAESRCQKKCNKCFLKRNNKIKNKNITCYWCNEKNGLAKLKLEGRWIKFNGDKNNMKSMNGKKIFGSCYREHKVNKKKQLWVLVKNFIWRAKGFKMMNFDTFLCKECDSNRCNNKDCGKLLSNTRKCSNPLCKEMHGSFYLDKPNYCKFCVDSGFVK